MKKKNEIKKMTVVFDVTSIKPISPSIKGKLRRKDFVDDLEDRSENRIRITNCQCMFSSGEDPNDIGLKFADEIEKELHSISKALSVKCVCIYAP